MARPGRTGSLRKQMEDTVRGGGGGEREGKKEGKKK